MIVYNLDHKDYSKIAISNWKKYGCIYSYGNLNELNKFSNKSNIIILIVRLSEYINHSIIDLLPNLKFVLTATTGINHIDTDYLIKKKIKLISLREEKIFLNQIPSTAEFTWGLILNIFRNITLSNFDVIDGNWNREKFKGFELKGKNIGIVGLGRIGYMVSQYATSFGMKVRYSDPIVNDDSIEKCNLQDLARKSDVLTIHIHPDKENLKLINNKIINLMPKGSYIINTSRGEIWDEKDVYSNLINGNLAGIASDVLIDEQNDFKKSILWKNRKDPKILLTPHLGGATLDAMWKCELHIQKIFFDNANMC